MTPADEKRGEAIAAKCPSEMVRPNYSNGKWNFPCVPKSEVGDAPAKKKKKGKVPLSKRKPPSAKFGRQLWKAMVQKAKKQGKKWSQLPVSDETRVAYRDWLAGNDVKTPQAPSKDQSQVTKWANWVKADKTGKRRAMVIKVARNPSNPNSEKAKAILKVLASS